MKLLKCLFSICMTNMWFSYICSRHYLLMSVISLYAVKCIVLARVLKYVGCWAHTFLSTDVSGLYRYIRRKSRSNCRWASTTERYLPIIGGFVSMHDDWNDWTEYRYFTPTAACTFIGQSMMY